MGESAVTEPLLPLRTPPLPMGIRELHRKINRRICSSRGKAGQAVTISVSIFWGQGKVEPSPSVSFCHFIVTLSFRVRTSGKSVRLTNFATSPLHLVHLVNVVGAHCISSRTICPRFREPSFINNNLQSEAAAKAKDHLLQVEWHSSRCTL